MSAPTEAQRLMQLGCPVCGEGSLNPDLKTPRLRVLRCRRCNHRVAAHDAGPVPGADYHEQYDTQGAFVDALRQTRLRQAKLILSRIRDRDPAADRLLDLGCGRGWFLECARASGFEVAGADTSELAMRLLEERGIPRALLPSDGTLPASLPFRPTVLTLLDVVEHFPPHEMARTIRQYVSQLRPELRLVVMKVPVSSGLLYRVSAAMGRAGLPGVIEQLYQAGTEPPHRSYFSAGSAHRTLGLAGLRVVDAIRDRDFEPALLAGRVRAFKAAPSILGRSIGAALAAAIASLHAEDSLMLFAT